MRIGLIATGECEQRGLASSLERVFAESDVEFELCFKRPVNSFTSSRLVYPPVGKKGPNSIDDFVDSIAASIMGRGAPDFVFAIDDLELANVATPQHVTALVRDAVVASPRRKTHAEEARFRERCSVHFLCPMVEAYFFGEPEALTRAGATREAILEQGRHLEALRVNELTYLTPSDIADHSWRAANRADHPKRYLSFLNDPEDKGERKYREVRQGRDALASLDWAQVFAHQPPGLAFALSLFDDLADAIGVPSPFPGRCHELTQRRAGGVLRNL